MNEIFIIIVLGVVSSFVIIFIKKYSPEFAIIASICAGCIILLFLVNEFVSIKKYVEKYRAYFTDKKLLELIENAIKDF